MNETDPIVRDGKKKIKFSWSSLPKFLLVLIISIPYILTIGTAAGIEQFLRKKLNIFYKTPTPYGPIKLSEDEIRNVKKLDDRNYDIVLFGATGFTGKLAARYIARTYGNNIRWAIAGRNKKSLLTLKAELLENVENLNSLDVLQCDSSEKESLIAVVSDTKVILTTVGPFAIYGTPLVSLCAQLGTSYCDITGEPDWVRSMITQYHHVAKKSGARIIHLCGNDSIPWDLSVQNLAKLLKNKGEELRNVQLFYEVVGGPSGGTLETLYYHTAILHQKPPKENIDPLSQTDSGEKFPATLTNNSYNLPYWSPLMKAYSTSGIMSFINFLAIKRTNSILQYSTKFTYTERSVEGGVFSAWSMTLLSLCFGTSILFFPTRWFLKKFVLPAPGYGPSKGALDRGYLKVTGFGEGDKGSRGKSVLYFNGDPGYKETARMIVETGMCLAFKSSSLEIEGGVFTSGCLGSVLLERLIDTGCYWKIEELPQKGH